MKKQVFFIIEDGSKDSILTKAYGKDDSAIFITSSTLQGALDLVPQAEELEAEDLKNWKPEPEPEKPEHHYTVFPISNEDGESLLNEYEATPQGARFVKALDNAREFSLKRDKRGFNCSQGHYLATKAVTQDVHGAIFDAYLYGYKRGYTAGKADSKKKA